MLRQCFEKQANLDLVKVCVMFVHTSQNCNFDLMIAIFRYASRLLALLLGKPSFTFHFITESSKWSSDACLIVTVSKFLQSTSRSIPTEVKDKITGSY